MSSSDYSIDSDDDEVRNINEEAQSITKQLIAKKSSAVYQNCYDNFKKWQLQNKTTDDPEVSRQMTILKRKVLQLCN